MSEAAPGSPRAAVAARLATLPRLYGFRDLLDLFPGPDRALLVEAYVQGWLPPEAAQELEERPERLSCWLLARLVRLGVPR